MKIPKVTPRLPFFRNLVSWPTAKWRSWMTPLRFLGRNPQPEEAKTLLDFSDLPGVYSLEVKDDRDIGGLSEGSIDWTEQGLELSGFIDAERAPKMIELPFIMYKAGFWIAVRSKANIIRVEARRLPVPEDVDPNEKDLVLPLLFNFKVADLEVKADVDIYATLCPDYEWASYDIHVNFMGSNEYDTFQGFHQVTDEGEFPEFPVREVYVKIRSAIDRHYNFQVRKVSLVYEPLGDDIKKVFPQRPVFYKKPKTYEYRKLSMNDYVTNENFFKDMDRELNRTTF